MQYPHNHTSQWIHLCHNSLQQGQWQANIQFWKWNGRCFHQVVCRWFVPFLKNILSRAVYISGPGIMGMEDTSQSTIPFSSVRVLICAFITVILKCFPVVHEVTWLTSVTCWCPHSLPRGRTMCSEVFCFIRHRLLYILLGGTRSNTCTFHTAQKVLWFVLVLAPVGVQPTDLSQTQVSFVFM